MCEINNLDDALDTLKTVIFCLKENSINDFCPLALSKELDKTAKYLESLEKFLEKK